jgi:hypothetical protein
VYDDLLQAMAAETVAEEARAAAYRAEHHGDEAEPDWDQVEAKMAEDPTTWPT